MSEQESSRRSQDKRRVAENSAGIEMSILEAEKTSNSMLLGAVGLGGLI